MLGTSFPGASPKSTGLASIVIQKRRTYAHPEEIYPVSCLKGVIAHVLLNTPTLKACPTATCCPWPIAALPHLHHTLALGDKPGNPTHAKFKPLQKLEKVAYCHSSNGSGSCRIESRAPNQTRLPGLYRGAQQLGMFLHTYEHSG